MPMSKYTGAEMGGGNPPGGYSKGYVKDPGGDYGSAKGHFVNDGSYRGSMHVGGIKESSPVVGNQPKQRKSEELNKWAKRPALTR